MSVASSEEGFDQSRRLVGKVVAAFGAVPAVLGWCALVTDAEPPVMGRPQRSAGPHRGRRSGDSGGGSVLLAKGALRPVEGDGVDRREVLVRPIVLEEDLDAVGAAVVLAQVAVAPPYWLLRTEWSPYWLLRLW